jgi:hypothetical protein
MDLVDAEKVINDSAALGDPLPIDSIGRIMLDKLFSIYLLSFFSVDKNHFIRLK